MITNQVKWTVIELLETRRIIGLMMLVMGVMISNRQSSMVNELVDANTGNILGAVMSMCGFVVGWKPHGKYSGMLSVPLLGYTLFNLWYALVLGQLVAVGAVLSGGVFVLVWADMVQFPTRSKRIALLVKRLRTVTVNKTSNNTSGSAVVYNLLHSKRFRTAFIGILVVVIVNLVPQLATKADLVSNIVAALVGVLIAGYTVTDMKTDAEGRVPGVIDAVQIALQELITAVFTSGVTPLDNPSATLQVLHPQTQQKMYVTISATPPATEKAKDDAPAG